jgi:hypothetical protein
MDGTREGRCNMGSDGMELVIVPVGISLENPVDIDGTFELITTLGINEEPPLGQELGFVVEGNMVIASDGSTLGHTVGLLLKGIVGESEGMSDSGMVDGKILGY